MDALQTYNMGVVYVVLGVLSILCSRVFLEDACEDSWSELQFWLWLSFAFVFCVMGFMFIKTGINIMNENNLFVQLSHIIHHHQTLKTKTTCQSAGCFHFINFQLFNTFLPYHHPYHSYPAFHALLSLGGQSQLLP